MAKTKTSVWRTIGIITVSLAVIIFYGIAITLFQMTLVSPAWIIGASLAFAAVTALVFRKKWRIITGTQNAFINVICHLVTATGLCMALILGVNFFDRDTSDSVTVRAEVVKIYSETRYRTKRISRNRYRRGEPYKVYYMDVRLPNGQECKRSISLQRYNRYARTSHLRQQRPDSVDLQLTKGALGMTIIEREPDK